MITLVHYPYSALRIPHSELAHSSIRPANPPLAPGTRLATLRFMPKFVLPLFLLAALFALSGCSLFHKGAPKSSAHIYEGDSPTLRFTDKPESAGGQVNPY